jgi:hypothetical protein
VVAPYQVPGTVPLEPDENRHVRPILRPFLPAVGRWNNDLSRVRAVLDSSVSSGFDKSCAVAVVQDLLREIAATQYEFDAATAAISRHSRVTDVQGSIKRLVDQLRALKAQADREYARHNVKRR